MQGDTPKGATLKIIYISNNFPVIRHKPKNDIIFLMESKFVITQDLLTAYKETQSNDTIQIVG